MRETNNIIYVIIQLRTAERNIFYIKQIMSVFMEVIKKFVIGF